MQYSQQRREGLTMTHDELRVDISVVKDINKLIQKQMKAIDAVMELHKPIEDEWFNVGETICEECTREEYTQPYPCSTIQAIEKELM